MGPLRSGDDGLPGCGCRKGERTSCTLKLTPFRRASGVQDITNKYVETKKTDRDEKDDQRGKQQERPGRRYDSDDSGDGDRDERDGDGQSDVRARWLHRSSGSTQSGDDSSGEKHSVNGALKVDRAPNFRWPPPARLGRCRPRRAS